MEDIRNVITVYLKDEKLVYDGNYYIYREDFVKEGCVHFRDADGNHHRIYNAPVVIDEKH